MLLPLVRIQFPTLHYVPPTSLTPEILPTPSRQLEACRRDAFSGYCPILPHCISARDEPGPSQILWNGLSLSRPVLYCYRIVSRMVVAGKTDDMEETLSQRDGVVKVRGHRRVTLCCGQDLDARTHVPPNLDSVPGEMAHPQPGAREPVLCHARHDRDRDSPGPNQRQQPHTRVLRRPRWVLTSPVGDMAPRAARPPQQMKSKDCPVCYQLMFTQRGLRKWTFSNSARSGVAVGLLLMPVWQRCVTRRLITSRIPFRTGPKIGEGIPPAERRLIKVQFTAAYVIPSTLKVAQLSSSSEGCRISGSPNISIPYLT